MVHMMKRNRFLLILGLFFKIFNLQAIIIDNPYIPLFDYAYQHKVDRRSVLASNVFVAMAHQGYTELQGTIPLPELFGKYNMTNTAKALVATGQPNPLPTSWQALPNLIWDMQGNLFVQGIWFDYEQYLGHDLSVGFRVPFMHVTTQLEFLEPEALKTIVGLGVGGEANLYTVLTQVNRALGFNSYQWQTTDFGDFDLYVRWGTVQDYAYKCRHIDLSLKIGALLPVTGKVALDTPIAIPLGANHHYGLYFETDFNCDLKDDLRVGFWLNATNRLAKNQVRRMAAGRELPQFGAIVGAAQVDPGLSIGFSPYVWLDDLRDGLGVRASYRMCWHGQDYWRDMRADNSVPAQLANVIDNSGWMAEWFTVGLVYDLQQNVNFYRAAPFFYLDLDIPSGVFSPHLVSKTYRLSAGFEFNF